MSKPLLAAAIAALALACAGSYEALRPAQRASGTPRNGGASDTSAVLIGAGDIARCGWDGDDRTADLVERLLRGSSFPAWVVAVGDVVYERGTMRDFRDCYHPSWGSFRDVTRPVPGNHEYKNGQLLGFIPLFGNADPYFAYFSAFPGQAGEPAEGWYHYRHGAWDVFALNTPGRRHMEPGSAAWNWLETELAQRDPAACSIAYYHYPRFSVGKHRDQPALAPLWELLDRHGVDVFLVAHDHNYQVFHPQTATGQPDSGGVRQFVVGTGGGELRQHFNPTAGALDRWTGDHYGVIKLTLHPGRYEWEYVTVAGAVWDTGSSPCQNR